MSSLLVEPSSRPGNFRFTRLFFFFFEIVSRSKAAFDIWKKITSLYWVHNDFNKINDRIKSPLSFIRFKGILFRFSLFFFYFTTLTSPFIVRVFVALEKILFFEVYIYIFYIVCEEVTRILDRCLHFLDAYFLVIRLIKNTWA